MALLDKLATAFLADPSEATLTNFLAVPKLAIHPAARLLSRDPRAAVQLLRSFPEVPPPSAPGTRLPTAENRLKSITKLIHNGRLGTAANLVRGNTKVVTVNDSVLAKLRSKHPPGVPNPFGSRPGPATGISPTQDNFLASLNAAKPFTAPGISGWTISLLKLATKVPTVLEMLSTLTGMIGQGTAPCRDLLVASRLTPLAKDDGGLRPIAVGDIIYRLATKTLLRHHFKPDSLLPCQFGVGTKGGTEPVTRTIQRALDRTLGHPYTHLTLLDFNNAFNQVDRVQIACALKEYLPGLYRTVKWAYNDPSDLVLGQYILQSATGVRQGDPLGPFLFSVAVRPLLRQLELTLGDNHRILAYLDDWYILSTTPGTLDKVYTLMDSQDTALKLNRDKCKEIALLDIAEHGLTVLGTRLGSPASQQAFLASKIDSLLQSLNNLASLPHQDALLLLRTCLQQDIRHLQRTMPISPQINAQWARLDQALCNEVRRLRGRSQRCQGDRQSLEDALIALPIRLGGLGILLHQNIAPLALAAANEAADKQINSLFDLEPDFATHNGQEANLDSLFDQEPNSATQDNLQPDFATHNGQEPNLNSQDNLQFNFATQNAQEPNFATQDNQEPNSATQDVLQPNFATHNEQEPNLDSLLDQEPNLDSLLDQEPNLAAQDNLQPDFATHSDQEPNSATQDVLQPNFATHNEQEPNFNSLFDQEPNVAAQDNLQPDFATQDEQEPNFDSLFDQEPNSAAHNNQEPNFATHNNQQSNFATQNAQEPNFATQHNQDPQEPTTGRSQHQRCEPMWQRQLETLIPLLSDPERKLLAESASKLGRRWLNTIPFYQTLSLSDFEVSTALHYRLLAPSPLSICAWCSKSNSLGHDELCMARPRLTVARHDSVARIIHSALKTVDPTAELEPHTFEGRRRNDIRLRGPVIGPVDFDIKVYTLLAADAQKTTTTPPQGTSLTSHITQQSVKYLDRVDRHVTLNRPLTSGRFAPLVFSAGGLMAKGTRDQIQGWKNKLKPPVFLRMESFISLALIKARARSFDVGRVEREEDDD